MNIFRHLLAAAPRIWPILTWACRRWRQIVSASRLGLNLRLFCTHRTPVLKSLDCWPALPLIVEYGAVPNLDPPAPGYDENIIAALKQSGRVRSINLTVTSSLLEKLSSISEPLSELEELVLLFQDNGKQIFPSTFLWGPRLRALHLTRIAFPSLLPLLLPCQDLVDLQLHEIPNSGIFPQKSSRVRCLGHPKLNHLHSTYFPSPAAGATLACLHSQRNASSSPHSLTSNIEGLASIWKSSWPELRRLVSGILKLGYLANLRWTLRNLADSSSKQKCTRRSFKQMSKPLRMPFRFLLPT